MIDREILGNSMSYPPCPVPPPAQPKKPKYKGYPRVECINGEKYYTYRDLVHTEKSYFKVTRRDEGESIFKNLLPLLLNEPKRDETWYCIQKNIFIETGLDLLQVEYCYCNDLGYHFEIHRASRTYDDSVILSLEIVQNDNRYLWGFGTKKMQTIFARFLLERRMTYATNEIGTIFNDYLRRYRAVKNEV